MIDLIKSKKIFFYLCFYFFYLSFFTFFIENSYSSDNKSGVIRGGFVIENSSSNPSTQNSQRASHDNIKNKKDKENINIDEREEISQQNREITNKEIKKVEKKINNIQNEEIDYKKIYFLLISAFILFIYLIFGLKKRGRNKNSGVNSNKYLR